MVLPRVKSMIYLTPTTAQKGAIRVLPATHTAAAQVLHRRLQALHGVITQSDRWKTGTFGISVVSSTDFSVVFRFFSGGSEFVEVELELPLDDLSLDELSLDELPLEAFTDSRN